MYKKSLINLVFLAVCIVCCNLNNNLFAQCSLNPIVQDISLVISQGTNVKALSFGGYTHGVDCESQSMQVICTFDFVFITPERFEVDPGDTKKLTANYNTRNLPVGQFSTSCTIHGQNTEPLVTEIGTFEIEVVPNPNKAFTFKCNKELQKWPVTDLEKIDLDYGDTESCTLRIINAEPGEKVEVSVNQRNGIRSAVNIDPVFAFTDDFGTAEFTITTARRGIDWISWAIADENNNFTFDKKAYEDGRAWGMFVEVR